MTRPLLLVLLVALASLPARAEVVSANAGNFKVHITIEAPVNHQYAYQRFLHIDRWWDADHTWFGDAAGLYIEPEAGGCFCEKQGEKSALHMIVSHVAPGSELRMIGGLGPLRDMGLHGAMKFSFKALADNATRITLEYQVVGTIDGDLPELASIVDQVLTGQLEGLRQYLSGTSGR